jgi:hypothetical protein
MAPLNMLYSNCSDLFKPYKEYIQESQAWLNLCADLDKSNVCSYTGAAWREPAPRCWGRDAGTWPVVNSPGWLAT